jgi:hypothetical protein
MTELITADQLIDGGRVQNRNTTNSPDSCCVKFRFNRHYEFMVQLTL